MKDLSSSHNSFFPVMTRKRFFAGGEGSSELPLSSNGPLTASPPSSGSLLRLAPGRSHSSSAALLRQRVSPSSSRTIKRDLHLDGFDYTAGYGLQPSSSSSSHVSFQILQGLLIVVFLGVCAFGMYTHETTMELQHALWMKDHEIDHHLEHVHALEDRVQKLRSETHRLNQQVEALEEVPANQAATLEVQRRLFHLEHYQTVVQQGIQAQDKRLVQETFGPGPYYYVEMTLEFPSYSNVYQKDSNNVILLETAHIDDMPHSIHLFLTQVQHELYDHTIFHRNADHIVQAGASGHYLHHNDLQPVLFQEYAPNFSHKPYTVGFPGRPGGPDFYINLLDNTQLHGPGHEGSDPCFAKVVAGRSVVDRLHQAQVRGPHQDIVAPVEIASMRVLSQDEYRLAKTKLQTEQA